MRLIRSVFVTALFVSSFSSCGGGGGGGGDFIGAAVVSLQAEPQRIDTGDRMLVTTHVAEVHPQGIALKFKYPVGLGYVPNTAQLEFNKTIVKITPTVDVASDQDNAVYLVFYLSQAQFTRPGSSYNGESGTVTFQLEGIEGFKDGSLEVDPDVDDPAEDNASEFKIDNPEFAAEDQLDVTVVG